MASFTSIKNKFKNILKSKKDFTDLKDINIAYLLVGFPTLSETFVLNELKYLVENDYNVTVFCYVDPMDPIELDFDLNVVRFDNVENPYNNLKKLLREYKIDLIHTHFVYPPATEFTYPVAKELNIPFTVFAHAVDIFKKVCDENNNLYEITNDKNCKAVFTLGNYHKNYLLERGVPEDKIIITKQATAYSITPLKEKDGEIKEIISLSRFVEKKGLDILVDSADILKDTDLNFSMYGGGILENEIQEKIQQLKLKNIKIKGVLNGAEEVRKSFSKSDVLVAPCKIAENGDRDGFPTVIFEAMAYGIPVITTNVSVIPEIIKDNVNGFIVDENDPQALANKIIEVKKLSKDKLFKIRKQAQQDVINTSSVEMTMNALIKTWRKIK